MKLFSIHPEVHSFDSAAQFCAEMQIGTGDLIISNEYILRPAFDGALQGADVLFQEKYGTGEPSDRLVESMARDLKGPYRRVFGIGGGSVIDVAKLFALKNILPVADLFDGKNRAGERQAADYCTDHLRHWQRDDQPLYPRHGIARDKARLPPATRSLPTRLC